MKQKIVSFKIAKAIKEAGYPQLKADWSYSAYNGELYNLVDTEDYFISAPTYLDVWLWLWREKKICINCNYDKYNMPPMWWCNNEDRINYNTPNFDDPEEAIINAIEFLVYNKLLK